MIIEFRTYAAFALQKVFMRSVILFILTSLTALSGIAQNNHPVSWTFSSDSIAPLTFRIAFAASINEPFHIYPQSYDGGMGMPTTISFAENTNVQVIGKVEEKGAGSPNGAAVAYYAKGVTFSQIIRLRADEKTTLHFRIRYMACTDQMCLPPSSKEYTLVVNDAGGVAAVAEDKRTDPAPGKQEVLKYEDFMLPDVEGKKISTKTIIPLNKYTFIDFWASWCSPCRMQAKALVPLYNRYRSKGFGVIGVSLDTDAAAWKKAIQNDGYTWTNLGDLKGFDSPVTKKYHIEAIPRNFLIDNKGVIIARDLHGKELEAKLNELLN